MNNENKTHTCCGNAKNCCHQEQVKEKECSQTDENGKCCGDESKCADEFGLNADNCAHSE